MDIKIDGVTYSEKNTGSFRRDTNGFAFFYDGVVRPGELMLLDMPPRTSNRRGVNDIGFCYEDGITLYATLSQKPDDENAVWQKIEPNDEVNKTVNWIAAVNSKDVDKRVNINVIMF